MSTRKLPPHIPGTLRQFRRRKRRELRRLMQAADVLCGASAYTPLYPKEVNALRDLLTTMHEKLSPAVWGD